MKCPRCSCERLYRLTRGSRWRCSGCRYDFSERITTPMRCGKKPREWYERILVLRAKGLNALQITKQMGGEYKSVWGFLRRAESMNV